MLNSFTTKVRTLLFKDEGTIAHEQGSRKRKRVDEFFDDGEDDDVVVVSIKRPKIEEQTFLSRVLTSPYKKMSNWVKSKTRWSDSFFFRSHPKNETKTLEQPPRNGRLNGGQKTCIRKEKYIGNRGVWVENDAGPGAALNRQQQQPQQPETTTEPRVDRLTKVTQTDAVNMVNGNGARVDGGMKQRSVWNPNHYTKGSLKFTANDCIDYEEKEQYRQLLQQFTTVPIIPEADQCLQARAPSTASQRSNDSLVKGNLSHSQSAMHYHASNIQKYTSTSRSISEMNSTSLLKRHSPAIEVMKKSAMARKVLHQQQTQDSKERPRPKHKTAVSVQKSSEASKGPCQFKECQYLKDEWMEDILTKYSVENRERSRKIAEEEIRSKVYEEKRKAREEHLEKEIQIRMKVLSTEPAFADEPTIEEVESESEEEEEVFPELTDQMDRIISNALRPHPGDEMLVEAFRLQITRKDMATLSGLNWLNDEIINFYMNLLMERGKQEGKAKVYACNTFFYPKIVSGGHSAVKRWTKKIDVFAQDYILIPVHLGMHWCLAVVDFKQKLVQYFDSMGGQNNQCLNAIKKYLCDESRDKRKRELDLTGWSTEIVKDIPQQMNGSDCGMFACKYAEYITRGADITFTQEHMPYFRRRMVYEILKATLLQ